MLNEAEILKEVTQWDTAAWFENFTKIERKGGELVRPTANAYQQRISDVVKYCHETGRPCRIVALKPRQKGSSTFSVAVGHNRLHAKRGRGLIAGGAHFQGKNLFKILGTYASNDDLRLKGCNVLDMEARYSNGSTMERLTLASPNAGRSGTYQVLIITEVAYLSEEGVANATNVLSGLMKCVPFEPDTIVIEESTAKGAQGDFYESFEGGITFEEFIAGRNGKIKIFAAWYEFEDSCREPTSEGIESEADYTVEESELAEKWKLSMGQVAWMRWAIREECKGDWDRFCQDYPFDPETAFLKSGACRFDAKGLEYQESLIDKRPREFGSFEYNERADRVSFVRMAEQQARAVRWETPRVGCRYLLSVDPMTGASQVAGEDPDSHGVFVLRAGYYDQYGWHEPAVVCRNILVPGRKPGSMECMWDIDVLEEEIWRMARYWQAIIVPEMNMDRGLVELLKLRGDVDIYQREMFNRREQVRTKALGWMTDPKTRPMIIENLARGIREAGRGVVGEGIEVRCPWAIKQMKNFVVKPNGRAEASSGHHDDDCFIAGTKIITPDGEVAIENLKVGDFVITRNGPRMILKTFSRVKPVISKLGLVGTASHPIILTKREKPLASVIASDRLYIWNKKKQKAEKRLYTKEKSITDTHCPKEDSCVYIFGDMINGSSPLSRYIGRYGLILMEKSQKAISCITLTAIRSIMSLQTLKSWMLGVTPESTWKTLSKKDLCAKQGRDKLIELWQLWQNGERNQRRNWLMRLRLKRHSLFLKGKFFAYVADLAFFPLFALPNIALKLATLGLVTAKLLQRRRVYNIHVEDTHEYFANGILVHNCMALAIGFQLVEMAVPWREVERDTWIPRDLQRIDNQKKRGGGQYS